MTEKYHELLVSKLDADKQTIITSGPRKLGTRRSRDGVEWEASQLATEIRGENAVKSADLAAIIVFTPLMSRASGRSTETETSLLDEAERAAPLTARAAAAATERVLEKILCIARIVCSFSFQKDRRSRSEAIFSQTEKCIFFVQINFPITKQFYEE